MFTNQGDYPELHLTGVYEQTSIEVHIDDPDVLNAIGRFDHPDTAICSLLKIGASATLATAASFDVRTVRNEMDQAISSVQGTIEEFQKQITASVGDDGPLTDGINKAMADLDKLLQAVLTSQADPEVSGSLMANLKGTVKEVKEALSQTRSEINQEFQKATTAQTDRVNGILREMRELDPNSALGGAFIRMEKRLNEIHTSVMVERATAAEREMGTQKGRDYETMVAAEVQAIACGLGDRAEQTGDHDGQALHKLGKSKRGDITCFVNGTPTIVVEVMDRARAQLTGVKVSDELNQAMVNRGAVTAIAVVSSEDNKLLLDQPLVILAPGMIAVHLDKHDPEPLPLRIAYQLARHMAAVTTRAESTIDIDAFKQGVDEINQRLGDLKQVSTQLRNIDQAQQEAARGLESFQREITLSITRLIRLISVLESDTEDKVQRAA